MIEEILCVARRQIRSIVDLCEEFDSRSKVQNLPIRTILHKNIKERLRTPLYLIILEISD